MGSRNYFGTMMVEKGAADGLISGLRQEYPDTIRPALEVIGTQEGVRLVAGAYILILGERLLFLADTTVNIEPTAAELADIALLAADFARRFDITPRVAMLSFSNFGSNRHPVAQKVRQACELVKARDARLAIDGEMMADTAVLASALEERFPGSDLRGPANVLVFPELQSANIAYKLLWRLTDAEAIGPILLGLKHPVHVLDSSADALEIANLAAYAVVEAQDAERHSQGR